MKNITGFITLLVFLVLGAVILALASCSKSQYIEHPTCFKYEQLIDRFNGEMVYTGTDTSYPSGKLFSIACDQDTMMFHEKPDTLGCATGYFSYRYEKQ